MAATELTRAGGARCRRSRGVVASARHRGQRERITALGTASQQVVDQASARRARSTARASSAQRGERTKRVGIGIVVGYFCRVDRAQGSNRRRFIGCHLGTNKIRDCDGRNDQNDGYYDQKFDK